MSVEGVWHTSILCYGLEWFYGGGIQCANPAVVQREYNMTPLKVLSLGTTTKSLQEIHAWCNSKMEEFSEERYDFLHHNCNTFTNELSLFLIGSGTEGERCRQEGIPRDILLQHELIAAHPGGKMIISMIDAFQKQAKQMQVQGGPAGFLATGRPVGQQAPIPAWTSHPDPFESILRTVWDNHEISMDLKREAFRRLYLLAYNIISHATDPKYRSIRANNDKIQGSILALPNGSDLLSALGFVYHSESGMYTIEEVDREVLEHLNRAAKLLTPVGQATAHQATTAVPPTIK